MSSARPYREPRAPRVPHQKKSNNSLNFTGTSHIIKLVKAKALLD